MPIAKTVVTVSDNRELKNIRVRITRDSQLILKFPIGTSKDEITNKITTMTNIAEQLVPVHRTIRGSLRPRSNVIKFTDYSSIAFAVAEIKNDDVVIRRNDYYAD